MTADRVDDLLKASTAVVASADSAILDACGDWLNLARISVERHRAELEPLWLLDPCWARTLMEKVEGGTHHSAPRWLDHSF